MIRKNLSHRLTAILNGDLPTDFNWNNDPHQLTPIPKYIPAEPSAKQLSEVEIVCEGLRDGIHGCKKHPSVSEMLDYIDLANQIGIREMTVGIYTGQGKIDEKIKELLKLMRRNYPKISPTVLSLASEESIKWAKQCHKINPSLKTLVFIGTAPSRMIAEGWDKKTIIERLTTSVSNASKAGLFVVGATEHTTQTPPDFLKQIIKVQVRNGAKTFCIADTIGISRPNGAYRIVKFVKKTLKEINKPDIPIEWHGHNDMNLAVQNTLSAISAGARRVHLVPWGIGERAGNTSLESFLIISAQILQNNGIVPPWKLTVLSKLLKTYAKITDNSIPNYGCMGRRAFNTSLGLHAAAMLKLNYMAQEAKQAGFKKLSEKLETMARKVYIAEDPVKFGRKVKIRISHWSGKHTLKLWAILKRIKKIDPKKIEKVLTRAKNLQRELTDKEIKEIIGKKINRHK